MTTSDPITLITKPRPTPPTRKSRSPSHPRGLHRLGVWRWVVSCFSSLFVPFVIQSLHAVQPYQPTYPDPVLEPWRWRTFPELKGLGLRCMARLYGVSSPSMTRDRI